jgi:hypothetical protein
VLLNAGQTRSSYDSVLSKSSSDLFSTTTSSTQTQASAATAQVNSVQGQNVSITAGKDLISVGTQFKGTDSLRVEGQDTSTFYAATDVNQISTTTQSSTSMLGLKLQDTTVSDSLATSTSIGTSLLSDKKIEIGVGNKTELQGAKVEAQQIAFVKTDPTKAGELILGGSTDTTQTSHTEKTETMGLYQEMKGKGSTTETLNQTQLKGNVSFDNALKITVQIPDTQGGQELKTAINALAAQGNGVGLDYLNALANNPNVDWEKVALAHDQWSYDQGGLTGAGAALLTIVVTYFTAGMGTAAVGTTTAAAGGAAGATVTTLGGVTLTSTAAGLTTAGIAVNAGFAALASQAAVAMVNNKGDLGKTLEQLGKEESIKGILLTMVTAGALDKLNSTMGWDSVNAKSTFVDQFQKNLGNNLATDMMNNALAGKPFDEKSFANSLQGALINTGMAQGANEIGNAYTNQPSVLPALNDFTHKVAHAVLGCAAGAATAGNSSGCAPGAVGAVVGELTAEYAKKSGMSDAQALGLARVIAATSGVLVGGGGDNAQAVNIAANTGANAAENNWLKHAEELKRNALREKQNKGIISSQEQKELAGLELLDGLRNQALLGACVNLSVDACAAQLKLDPAAKRYGYDNIGVIALGRMLSQFKDNAGDAISPLAKELEKFEIKPSIDLKGQITGWAVDIGSGGDATNLKYMLGAGVYVGTEILLPTNAIEVLPLGGLGVKIAVREGERILVDAAGRKMASLEAKAYATAEAEALTDTQKLLNFYRDGGAYEFPKKITTSSGVVVEANPNKTTTILGTYGADTQRIINTELGLPRSVLIDGAVQPGSFNLLNTPDSLYVALGQEKFWQQVNKPFLDAAIQRGDDIVLATKPEQRFLTRLASDGSGAIETTGFGKEYEYLKMQGYVYEAKTGKMIRSVK